MEAHDCNFHDALQVCINERCPLHRAMRNLSANLATVGFGAVMFRAGDNFGFHMGSDESQCTCQWSPNVNGEAYVGATRCEQDMLEERDREPEDELDADWLEGDTPPPPFPAGYATACIGCNHGIRAGDMVRLYEEGYVHADGCPRIEA